MINWMPSPNTDVGCIKGKVYCSVPCLFTFLPEIEKSFIFWGPLIYKTVP